MATIKQWLNWVKCNVLELIILILVLVLLVKAFSAPVVEGAALEVPVGEVLTEGTPVAEIPAPPTAEPPLEVVPVEETAAK